MRFRQPVSLLVLLLLVSAPALAQVPQLLNYQGRLVSGGEPVSGDQTLTFRIYDVDTGGTELWSETQTVPVADGVFSVILGSMTPLGEVFGGSGERYLGVQVQGESEMTPRLQFVSSSYALRTQSADDVADGVVTAAKIQDGAVAADKLAQMGAALGQVLKWDGSAWQPAADNIGTPGGGITEIIAGTGLSGGGTQSPVTIGIADGGVGGAQIATDAVTRTKIAAQSVSNSKIRDGAVSAEKIATGAVLANKLDQMGAAAGQVLKWTGTMWAPAADDGGTGGGNTLDQAYDQGGAGAGRAITADAGPVVITGAGLSTTDLVASVIIGGSVEVLQGGGEEGGQMTIWDADGQGAWEIDNFGASGTELLRIFRDKGFNNISSAWVVTTEGNVGIGTSSPATRLDVQGRIRSEAGGFVFPDGTVQTTAAAGSGGGFTELTFLSGALTIIATGASIPAGATVKILDVPVQLTKRRSDTDLEITFTGSFRATGSTTEFEIRLNDQGPADGVASAVLAAAGTYPATIYGVFRGLTAGTYTLSFWGRASRVGPSDVILNPGGWNNQVVVKEILR